MKKIIIVSLALAVSLGFIPPIHGYVLQGRHVLDLMLEKLGAAETLFVSQKVFFYRTVLAADRSSAAADAAPQAPFDAGAGAAMPFRINRKAPPLETIELEESLRFVFSDSFRSDARSQNSERIYIFSHGGALTIVDGSIVPDAANRFDLYKDILLYRSRQALADRLMDLGVDVSISSLGRFEDKIAFVLGAEYPDETVNQLWVDKETLLPLRLIMKGRAGGAAPHTVEVRYLTWWKIGETRYPSRIEFYQDENLVRVNQAGDFEENAAFPEDLFNIEHLQMVYPRTLPLPPVAAGAPDEPSEVQKTIDEFERIFE